MSKATRKETRGFAMVLGYLGLFMILIGIITTIPLFMCFYPGESECWMDFVIPAGINMVLGLLLYFCFLFKRKTTKFVRYEDSQLLFLIWILAIVSGAAPMFIACARGEMDMDFSEAIFEATSAYSTTGLNVFKDFLDTEGAFCPHVYTFHRSLMQFIGGVGLVLLLTTLLGGNGSTILYQTEGHNDHIMTTMGKTAKVIFGIYTIYTILGAFALWFSGMPAFDAACTSMCALSSGGLSPRSSNIAFYRDYEGMVQNFHWENGVVGGNKVPEPYGGAIFPVNSLAIEIVMMVLVILSAVSFVLHVFALRGKWKDFFRDDEIRFCMLWTGSLLLFSLGGAFLTLGRDNLNRGQEYFANWPDTIRDIFFYVIGSWTSSGFSNTTLTRMISLGKPLLFASLMLMLVGGGSGSTAGGIKQYRVAILLRDLRYSIVTRFAPSIKMVPCSTYRYGKHSELDASTVKEAHNYFFLFISMFAASVLILCFCPSGEASSFADTSVNIETVSYNVASAASNTGLGVTNFVNYRDFVRSINEGWYYPLYLWVLSIDMFLGRLEIMPLIYSAQNIHLEFTHAKEVAKGKSEKRHAQYLENGL